MSMFLYLWWLILLFFCQVCLLAEKWPSRQSGNVSWWHKANMRGKDNSTATRKTRSEWMCTRMPLGNLSRSERNFFPNGLYRIRIFSVTCLHKHFLFWSGFYSDILCPCKRCYWFLTNDIRAVLPAVLSVVETNYLQFISPSKTETLNPTIINNNSNSNYIRIGIQFCLSIRTWPNLIRNVFMALKVVSWMVKKGGIHRWLWTMFSYCLV